MNLIRFFCLFLAYSMLHNCSNSKLTNPIGSYCLKTKHDIKIAELIEIREDSTFVISGLEEEVGYKYTTEAEGHWKLEVDTLVLNTGDYEKISSYGHKMNTIFLNNYADSISYLDQVIRAVRNNRFTIKADYLVLQSKRAPLSYEIVTSKR